jgi:hypothetical protein
MYRCKFNGFSYRVVSISIADRNGEVHEVSSMGPGESPLEFKFRVFMLPGNSARWQSQWQDRR